MAEKKEFHDYIAPDNILCNVNTSSQEEVIQLLLHTLNRHYPALSIAQAAQEIAAREAIYPTMVAPLLAVPHARLPGLTAPLVAVATCTQNVDFSSDIGPARLIVLILSPLDDPNSHMQLLATLAGFFSTPESIEKLLTAKTPVELWNFLSGSTMPDYLKAADVMCPNPPILHETDSLQHAIITFAQTRSAELVVLDRDGDLRGVLNLEDLLGFSLPEHLLWLEDLSPVYQFQPFAEMLQNSGETKVADLMHDDFIAVDRNVPAIQLAKMFLMHKARQLVITGAGGKLAGVVELKDFCGKLFWE